jgi:hypothetical protein
MALSKFDREALFWVAVACLAATIVGFTLFGCTAVPPIVGTIAGGGVTLYKSAKESGPKAEFVAVKLEVHHDTIYVQAPSPSPAIK